MPSIWRRLMPAVITMAAAILATIQLGDTSLWHDEAVTWQRASQSIPEMIEDINHNVHGPFYYSIMHVWLKFGGDSEFWMRFFSALCFTFTAPVVYVIGRTVGGQRVGLYAACLMATAPFLIRYAQEARMYAMLTFFCSLALMSVALLISKPADQPPPVIGAGLRARWRRDVSVLHSRRGDDTLWATYIIAVLGGMISHNTAVALPAVTSLIFLVAIAAAPRFRWRRLRNLIAANAVVLVLYAFYIPFLLINFSVFGSRPATPVSILRIPRNFVLSYGNEHLPLQAVVLAALCALALWRWRRREDWKWIGFTLVGSLGLPLMLFIASNLFRPMLIDRTMIWGAIPLYIACGVGLARLPNANLRRLVLAGLLLGNLYGVLNEYRYIPEPWDQVVQAVAETASSDDAVVLCPVHAAYPFNYYRRDYEFELAVFGARKKISPYLSSASDEVALGRWALGEPRDLMSLFDDYSEVWVVFREDSGVTCDSPELRDAVSGRGQLVAERKLISENLKLFVLRAD